MLQYVFHFLSILALTSAVMVIASKRPMHSILYLIVTFFALAGHYVLLSAQFLAVVQVIVYAGAIMVLFLFVVMLLNLNEDKTERLKPIWKVAAVAAGGMFLILLVATVKSAAAGVQTDAAIVQNTALVGQVKTLGKELFTKFLMPFEVASLLFLVAMIGAVLLGKKEIE